MGYIQKYFHYISLNDQPITETGICRKTWGFLRGQFFEPMHITEHVFNNLSPVFQSSEMCSFRKKKEKNKVTELYHSNFILGQVGIIIQNKVVQNLIRNKVN